LPLAQPASEFSDHLEGSALSAASIVSAVVRPPHSAAARRALLTLLFLGGFLALAVAFGGSANAVSDAGHEARQAGGAASGLLKSEKPSGKATGKKARGTGDRAGRAAADTKDKAKDKARDSKRKAKSSTGPGKSLTGAELAHQQPQSGQLTAGRATSQVLGPFVDGLEGAGQITRPVGEAVQDVAGSAGLPGGLGLGGLGGNGGGTPGGGGHAGHDAPGDDSCGAATHGTGDRLNAHGPQGSRGLPPGAFLAASGAHATVGEGLGDGLDGDGGAPADRLPFGDTPAVPAPGASAQYTADGQSQRGGPHQFAAVVDCDEHLVPLRSGAVSAADGTPTRERAGDVLEFPG
jgi:hypothetical protein